MLLDAERHAADWQSGMTWSGGSLSRTGVRREIAAVLSAAALPGTISVPAWALLEPATPHNHHVHTWLHGLLRSPA